MLSKGSVSATERVRAKLKEHSGCADGECSMVGYGGVDALEIALEALEPHQKQWAIVAIERIADALEQK